MPNITVYMDNKTYTKFISMKEGKQRMLKETFIQSVKDERNK